MGIRRLQALGVSAAKRLTGVFEQAGLLCLITALEVVSEISVTHVAEANDLQESQRGRGLNVKSTVFVGLICSPTDLPECGVRRHAPVHVASQGAS